MSEAQLSRPPITKKAAIKAAIKLINKDGLDRFSMRRLGRELDVEAMALYHHFENKEALLVAICEHVFTEQRIAKDDTDDVVQMFLENGKRYHAALCRHRNLIPILIRHHPLKVGARMEELVIKHFSTLGISGAVVVTLTEAIAKLALGSASYFHAAKSDALSKEWRQRHSGLDEALRAQYLSHEQLFALSAEAIIGRILDDAAGR